MDAQKVAQLRGFVELLQAKPEVVHMPEMKFFKDFLVAWGATIPQPQAAGAPKDEAKKAGGCGGCPAGGCGDKKKCEEEKATKQESDSAGEEEDIVTEADSDIEVATEVELDEEPLELEDESTFPSAGKVDEIEADADFDKQGELKEAAQEALEDGKLDVAIAKLSEAMEVGSCSALMFAKRADLLLKAKRPAAALRDASAALAINENSAKALRVKGVIHRRLHEWAEARTELSAAQQMDFDDEVEETLHFVVKQATAHDAHERDAKAQAARRERRHREAERKRRVHAYDKAKKNDAREAKASGGRGFPGGMPGGFPGGMPGGMPAGAEAAFSDPEVMAALQDPRVMEAISAMQSGDTSKFMALQSDPVLGPKIMKLMGSLGGAMGGGMPGGMGGMPGGAGGMFGGMGGGMPGAGAPAGDANVEECD